MVLDLTRMRHSDGCHPAGAVFNFVITLYSIVYTMINILSSILVNKFAMLYELHYIAIIVHNKPKG